MNEQDAIAKAMTTIGKIGCDKVITTWDGGSVPYEDAIKEYDIEVELIFIRKDGWTLGAHRTMYGNAYNLYADEWVAVLIKPMIQPISIDSFIKIGNKGVNKILPLEIKTPKRIPQPKYKNE